MFTTEQMATLEQTFSKQRYLPIPERLDLARELRLTEQQVNAQAPGFLTYTLALAVRI